MRYATWEFKVLRLHAAAVVHWLRMESLDVRYAMRLC